jgi:hypothetical protein
MPAITFTHSSVCPRTSERKLLEFSFWATAYGVGLPLLLARASRRMIPIALASAACI